MATQGLKRPQTVGQGVVEQKGGLLILVGPSASGKTTLAEKLVAGGHAVRQITCTTRAPRPGEKHGVDYFFASHDEFVELREKGGLLEWAKVHGNFYGTPKSELVAKLSRGQSVVLAIDISGLRQLKQHADLHQWANLFSVFIYAGETTIHRRLVNRALAAKKPISRAELQTRLATASEELRCMGECHQSVANDLDGEVYLNSAFMDLLRKIDAHHRPKVIRRFASRPSSPHRSVVPA